MLSRGRPVYRFAMSAQEKRRFKENVANDGKQIFKKFNMVNKRKAIGDFNNFLHSSQYLEKSQIETRILRVIYDSELFNIKNYQFDMDLRSDLKLDSLNIVVLLTSIEHEFTTVFEDRVFDSVRNLSEIVHLLIKDEKVF